MPVYKDNAFNRKLGRVGEPHGSCILKCEAKKEPIKKVKKLPVKKKSVKKSPVKETTKVLKRQYEQAVEGMVATQRSDPRTGRLRDRTSAMKKEHLEWEKKYSDLSSRLVASRKSDIRKEHEKQHKLLVEGTTLLSGPAPRRIHMSSAEIKRTKPAIHSAHGDIPLSVKEAQFMFKTQHLRAQVVPQNTRALEQEMAHTKRIQEMMENPEKHTFHGRKLLKKPQKKKVKRVKQKKQAAKTSPYRGPEWPFWPK